MIGLSSYYYYNEIKGNLFKFHTISFTNIAFLGQLYCGISGNNISATENL
jgi:hypothetical protein